MKKIVLILSIATLFTSCSIYKKYSRPEEISTNNLYGNIERGDTITMADVSWRDFFTDKHLQGYIEQGLKNNIDMRLAAERVSQAELALQSARLAFIPSFSFEPSASVSLAPQSAQYAYTLPVKASWEIDIMARNINAKRRAEASLEYNKLYRRSVQTALVAAIANNYYTLLMLDAQLRISRSTSASWKENVRTMKAMKEAGMTNAASISQTEANSCSIDASLYDLEYKLVQAQNAFALLLGVTPQEFPRSELNGVDFKQELFVGVPAQLLSRRPDVQQAEYNLMLAFYNTNIAHANLYPSLTITGDGALKGLPTSWAFSFLAKLVQPIFNAGKNRANYKIAQSQQREAMLNFEHKLLEAGSEVNTALAQCRSARSKTDLRIRQIENLSQAVYSTRQLMSHSEATYLEVLTAQQSLLSARLLQVSDRFEGIQGVINLYRALGGGVDTSVEPATEKNPIFKCKKRAAKEKKEKK
ncbi:MAG: efflux transporter outer membrane subunit [Rikenellaceae bacterium]|nr:efflux transporter outer membrane subunit [Rikenellaceae bacterium]